MTLYQKIDLVIKVVGGLTALILFIVGFIRYRKDQIWRRKEFVSKEIKDFFEDHTIHNCLLMLDWDMRYIELYPSNPEFDKRFSKIGRKEITSALIPHGEFKYKYTRDESLIRDSFDYFLDRLSRLEHFIQANLIEPSDLIPYVKYWIDTIADDLPEPLKSTLKNYIEHYKYADIIRLFSRFNKNIRPRLTIKEIAGVLEKESINNMKNSGLKN